MKIGAIQIDIALGKPEENRQRVEVKVMEAAKKGAEVIILPEMWNTGYALTKLDNISDVDGQPTTGFLSDLAGRLNVDIIGGSISNKVGDRFYNHAMVINNHGSLVYIYDKIHLIKLMNEHRFITGGSRADVFSLRDTTWGLIICYDLRFPELSRKLALKGAEILVVPAEWPKVRLHHWRSLLIARAIENQQYVIAVNRVGQDDQNIFAGHSMVIDPLGDILYEAGEEEETIIMDINVEKVAEVRDFIPVFKDRHPDCY